MWRGGSRRALGSWRGGVTRGVGGRPAGGIACGPDVVWCVAVGGGCRVRSADCGTHAAGGAVVGVGFGPSGVGCVGVGVGGGVAGVGCGAAVLRRCVGAADGAEVGVDGAAVGVDGAAVGADCRAAGTECAAAGPGCIPRGVGRAAVGAGCGAHGAHGAVDVGDCAVGGVPGEAGPERRVQWGWLRSVSRRPPRSIWRAACQAMRLGSTLRGRVRAMNGGWRPSAVHQLAIA